jgi:hypothetical protein
MKPSVLTKGACRDDQTGPCCADANRKWALLQKGPAVGLEYPFCRDDGFFKAKVDHGIGLTMLPIGD